MAATRVVGDALANTCVTGVGAVEPRGVAGTLGVRNDNVASLDAHAAVTLSSAIPTVDWTRKRMPPNYGSRVSGPSATLELCPMPHSHSGTAFRTRTRRSRVVSEYE